MKFILTIDCDGAAFTNVTNDEDNGTPNPGPEVAQVLRRLMLASPGYSHRNLASADPGDRTETNPFVLFDTNGVSVGTAYFEEA